MDEDLMRFKKFCHIVYPCVEWTGATSKGYGSFFCGGKLHRAARWIFEQARGKIPAGCELHHRCRNPRCIRPDHLVALPHDKHMRIHAKFGSWNGKRNSNAKRTEEEVLTIRFLAEYFRLSVAEISENLNIPLRSVYWILNGGGWAHLQLSGKEELEGKYAEMMLEAA